MTEPILFLTLSEVEDMHADQIREFGGSMGVRNLGGLKSAVAQPEAMFGGEYLHQGLFEMAAAYAFHIAENQPFVDGNKRAALNAALNFLALNGFEVVDEEGLLYPAMIGLSDKTWNKPTLAVLLERLSIPWKDET